MLYVFIYEAFTVQQNSIVKNVTDFLSKREYDMELAVVTENPDRIIEYLKANPVTGLYFLDLSLWNKMDGLALASTIRGLDPRGFIVFITTYEGAIPVAFTHPIDAMEVILKDYAAAMRLRIEECLADAHHKYTARAEERQSVFAYKSLGLVHSVKTWDIVCFEALKEVNKVMLHTLYGINEFYSSLYEVEKTLKRNFIKCHRSYIINIEHLKEYDKENKKAYMDIGMTIPVSRRSAVKLANIVKISRIFMIEKRT